MNADELIGQAIDQINELERQQVAELRRPQQRLLIGRCVWILKRDDRTVAHQWSGPEVRAQAETMLRQIIVDDVERIERQKP